MESCLDKAPYILFSWEVYYMCTQENNQETSNLLLDAASIWKELTDYRYEITYGYKKNLYEIHLCFYPEEFQHLAGFQYLKDINLPRYNSSALLDRILSQKITYEQIIKGSQYETMVKPRLEALSKLKATLNSDFTLFSYMPRMYSFTTTIKADYLISLHSEQTSFVFIVKTSDTSSNYLCCSAFIEGNRDYEENQRQRTILKKECIKISTNNVVTFLNRLD